MGRGPPGNQAVEQEKCSYFAKYFVVHISKWYHVLASECPFQNSMNLMHMLEGDGPSRSAATAFFDTDPQLERECRIEEIQCLHYESEDYFLFGNYRMAFNTLLRLRAIQMVVYGVGSWQVLDTDHELTGLLFIWSFEKNVLLGQSGCEMALNNLAERFWTLKEMGSRADHVPNQYSCKFLYPFGSNCSKIFMASAVAILANGKVQIESPGMKEDVYSYSDKEYKWRMDLKLRQGAFEDRLVKFGPDSLLTLTAQRTYYIRCWRVRERNLGADIKAKQNLVLKLRQLLGSHHKQCWELERKIGLEGGFSTGSVLVFLEPELLKKVRPEAERPVTKPTVMLKNELPNPVLEPPPAPLEKKKRKKKKSKKKSEPEVMQSQKSGRKKHASNGYESCSSSFASEVNLRDCVSSNSDSGTMCGDEVLCFRSCGSDDVEALGTRYVDGFTSPDEEDWITVTEKSRWRWKSIAGVKQTPIQGSREDVKEHNENESMKKTHVEARTEEIGKTSMTSNVQEVKKKERKKYIKNIETGEKVAIIVPIPTTDHSGYKSELESSTLAEVESVQNEQNSKKEQPKSEVQTGSAPEAQKFKKTVLPKSPQTPQKLPMHKPLQPIQSPPLKKGPEKPSSPPKSPSKAVFRPPTHPQQDPLVKASKDQWQTFVTFNGPQDPQTLTLQIKHAECLLQDHQYDEAFGFLLHLFPIEAQQRGYNHEVPMTILSQLCSPLLCKEFVSFQVLQAVKSFLYTEVSIISTKLSHSHRATIKTQFFQGYLTSIVDDNIVEADRMMTTARDNFKAIYGQSDADFFFNWKIAMNLVNLRGQEWRANTLFEQAKTRIPKNSKRLKLLYDADAALVQAKLFQYNHAWTEIQKTYSKASISENQKPNDPIVIYVLEVALEIVEMIQACDIVQDIQDLSLFKGAYDRQELLLGPLHPNAVKVAVIYCAANYNPQRANKDKDYKLPQGLLSFCTETVDRSNSIFGAVHQVTTRAKQVLAGLLSIEGGQTGLLKRHLSEAVRDRKTVFGEKHEAYYGFCKRASVIYETIGDLHTAAQHATIWKNGSEGKHGVKHSESSKAKKTVRKVLNEQNRRFGAV